ncbi:MAG: hypothetical protein QOG95_4150, partial [Mycobacterium sp.]|nr:hypothetical protein [Mycobacterium sp.]
LETVAMLRDVAHSRTWRGRLGYIFGPPGWTEKRPADENPETLIVA